jgi:hypothetical protein
MNSWPSGEAPVEVGNEAMVFTEAATRHFSYISTEELRLITIETAEMQLSQGCSSSLIRNGLRRRARHFGDWVPHLSGTESPRSMMEECLACWLAGVTTMGSVGPTCAPAIAANSKVRSPSHSPPTDQADWLFSSDSI